ncbi:Calx-beta domain-containing protein [Aquisphaera giovannonii]|nr:Calx-beta domain-containing protein [Aquisphaera giovannonii]
MESRLLLATFVVQRVADDLDAGSLRWAILQADAGGGGDTIRFDLPGDGVQRISPTSPLPSITRSVTIDGTTQPGYAGQPLIRIDGSAPGAQGDGLVLEAGGSIIRGLAIGGFSGAGIRVQRSDGNVIQGNYLGTDETGQSARPNRVGILLEDASANTIGGTAARDGNLISGNLGNGVTIAVVASTSSANVVQGNLVGTAAGGLGALGNGGSGIVLWGAAGNSVGGLVSSARNVVSGNLQDGIGLDSGAASNQLLGNFIGTTADGRAALGNRKDGIRLNGAGGNQIGGIEPGVGNVIGGNLGSGVETFGALGGNRIFGNAIGTDSSGLVPLGNGVNGVTLGSEGNSVGGSTAGSGNIIAFNGTGAVGAGVQLVGLVAGNAILFNSIHDNAGLGINLGNGPTPNHSPGMIMGPNDFQNYPVLSAAATDGATLSAAGTLDAARSSSYTIQLFGSPTPDPSGFGEGAVFLGSKSVTTDSMGRATFNFGLPSTIQPGMVLSATATDSGGNTSEFSPDLVIRAMADLSVSVAANPSPAYPGAALTYTITISNKSQATAHNVVLTNSLPLGLAGLSVTSATGVSTALAGRVLTATMAQLPGGASTTITVSATVAAAPGTSLVDTATVTLAEPDPDPADNAATATVPVLAVADVSLSGSPLPGGVRLGSTFPVTFVASNAGTTPATGVVLAVPIGPGFAFVSGGSTPGTASFAGGVVSVDLGTLDAGSSATIQILLRAVAVGESDIQGTLTTDDIDPTPDDHAASVPVDVVPSSWLNLGLSMPSGTSHQGDLFTYSVSVTNIGPSDATGVTLALPLAPGLKPISATSTLGAAPVLEDDGSYRAAIGMIPYQGTVTITIQLRLDLPVDSVPANYTLSAAVAADDFDPGTGAGTISAPLVVEPADDLSVGLALASPAARVGDPITLAGTVTNAGPSDATDARLRIPLPPNVSFVRADAGGRRFDYDGASGVLDLSLGTMSPGESVTFSVTLLAQSPGPATWTASVSGTPYDLQTANNAAAASVDIQDAPGTLCLASTSLTVPETAGYAVFPVVRTLGTLEGASIHYWTGGGNATPGVDYTPISGILTFAAGQTVANVVVPVLANPHDRTDEYVTLTFDSPGVGVAWDGPTTATLHIVDTDPDNTPPAVADVRWYGPANAIDRITVRFSEPLVAAMADNPGAYMLADLGTSGRPSPGDATLVGLAMPTYDPSTSTVTLVPAQPLAAGHFYRILVAGTGGAAITDLAGNPLAGSSTGIPGTNYTALFGRGTTLKYYDGGGNLVTIKAQRGGFLDLLRSATGQGLSLRLQGGIPGRTVLTGSVGRGNRPQGGTTTLEDVEGLGQFGQVRVNMSARTFLVKQTPFLARNSKALAAPAATAPTPRHPARAKAKLAARVAPKRR